MSDVSSSTIVTLSEMRAYLGVPAGQTGKDNLIISLLDSCNGRIENYLGVTLINSTYTEEYDGDEKSTLFLKHYPIISVSSLTIDGTSQTEDDDFFVYNEEGYIKLDSDTFSSTDLHNVDITYSAGWGATRAVVPDVLKDCLKKWVMRIFKAENVDFSQQFDESSLAHIKSQMMPWDIKQDLDYYRCRRY